MAEADFDEHDKVVRLHHQVDFAKSAAKVPFDTVQAAALEVFTGG